MSNILSMNFKYNNSIFDVLVRLKENGTKREYYVTIMNGELEKLLFGSHIFVEVDGHLQIADGHYSEEVLRLRSIIGEALSTYLNQSHFSH